MSEFEDAEVTDEGDDLEDLEEEESVPRARRVTQDWLWEMNAVVHAMYARDDIDVRFYNTYDPVSLFVLEQAETSMGMVIPDAIRSFYEVTDGMELQWSWRDGEEWRPGGEVHMHSFGKVFGSWLDSLWGHSDSDSSDVIDFTWELRGVEQQASWEADWTTVLHMPEDLPTYQLYIHDPRAQTVMLDLDFLDYCEAIIDTRGVYGWQFLATEADFEEMPEIGAHAANALEIMGKVFPDVDISRFRNLED